MMKTLVLAAIAAGSSTLVLGATVQVRLLASPGAQAACARGGVLAAIASDDDGTRVETSLQPDAPDALALTLADDRLWQLRVESGGCWSETATWTGTDPAAITLRVHRAAELGGRFESDGRKVDAVEGVIFPVKSAGASSFPLMCSVAFPEWKCVAPSDLPFDLRLDARGFASIHYWSVIAQPAERTTLEPRRLLAGGSLSGWIHDSRGTPIEGARVALYPREANRQDDARRTEARRWNAVTNARGFFQVTQLAPGQYRLVSEAKGFSPAAVPEIAIDEGEPLVWPRPIAHPPYASLDLALYPSTDPSGKPWLVAVAPQSPLHLERPSPLVRAATAEGRWTAERLRADVYRIVVSNSADSELERLDVDLSEGGRRTLSINVRSIAVRGVVRRGEEPLAADVAFRNDSGKQVRVSASNDGRFETAFPVSGTWSPYVRYPAGSGTTIELDPIEIADGATGGTQELQIEVPGGRVRGEVVGPSGAPERAAVYVVRNGNPVAQGIVNDGKFDFVGIAPGSYTVDAKGERSATPHPVPIRIENGETKEVRLVVEPHRLVRGTVLTPHGTPASGAVVQILVDEGRSWSRVITDVEGSFEYPVAAAAPDVQVVVLAYGYPSATARIAAASRAPVTIALKRAGGILRVKNASTPYIRTGEVFAPIRSFYFPEPRGRFDGGVYLEPGTYLVCPGARMNASCRSATIGTAGEVEVTFPETP